MDNSVYYILVIFLVVSSFFCTTCWILHFNSSNKKDYISLQYNEPYDSIVKL